jgi:ribosome-associated heat shock protein Hsp15
MSEATSLSAHPYPVEEVRLDVWLWAARFFKTRTLSKQAIEAGHVRYDGERAKAAKSVHVGALLTIRQGFDEIEITVLTLSDHRGPAPMARLLYAETGASRERREQAAALSKSAAGLVSHERPTKQQRRLLHRFKRDLGIDD